MYWSWLDEIWRLNWPTVSWLKNDQTVSAVPHAVDGRRHTGITVAFDPWHSSHTVSMMTVAHRKRGCVSVGLACIGMALSRIHGTDARRSLGYDDLSFLSHGCIPQTQHFFFKNTHTETKKGSFLTTRFQCSIIYHFHLDNERCRGNADPNLCIVRSDVGIL